MSDAKWRGGCRGSLSCRGSLCCRESLWGDDSRSYNAPGLIPISPIPREIHVFPTHGTFLWLQEHSIGKFQ